MSLSLQRKAWVAAADPYRNESLLRARTCGRVLLPPPPPPDTTVQLHAGYAIRREVLEVASRPRAGRLCPRRHEDEVIAAILCI